jgi:hypothetical protein
MVQIECNALHNTVDIPCNPAFRVSNMLKQAAEQGLGCFMHMNRE